jgi:hypothetical protein
MEQKYLMIKTNNKKIRTLFSCLVIFKGLIFY